MNRLKLSCIMFVCMITVCSASHQPAFDSQRPVVTISPNALSSWELSGAIAARNKKRGWTAVLNWLQQGPNQYQIRLFGPLGGGSVLIEKKGSVITFRDGPKKVSSNNADELLQKKTGVRLPVKNLYYWVRGLPAPGAIQSAHHDANNYLISFNQAGYTVNYTAYTVVGGMNLPSKIRLQEHGVLIKLVIKHWKI